jgi:hypothetical protein
MLDVSTSLQCSNAFVEQYFVTNPAVVEQLTEVNMAMHDLCTSFTTQVCSVEATPSHRHHGITAPLCVYGASLC